MSDSTVKQLHLRARTLAARFGEVRRTTKGYIDEAIAVDREALQLCPPGHHMRSLSLTWLSIHLSIRYEQFDTIGDIDEAIVLDRDALELYSQGHPHRLVTLNNLAALLSTRYSKFRAATDLDEAIVFGREALELCPHDHPDRSTCLNNFAVRLSLRYNKFGTTADLDEAIVFGREALKLCSQGHPLRSASLNNLGSCLATRYNRFGAATDLDEAIALARETLKLHPRDHPHLPMSLNSLAARLSIRCNNFGAISDLDEAIVLARKVLDLRPPFHPHRPISLDNLGVYLSTRYGKSGLISDLDEAITLTREALEWRPQGHPNRSTSLNNLGSYLFARYNGFDANDDVEEAIVLGREALELCPRGHPDRSTFLSNFADQLYARYNKFGTVANLDEAITIGLEALELRPQGHPDRWKSLKNLAYYLSTRYNKPEARRSLNVSSNNLEEVFCLYVQFAGLSYTVSSGDLEASRAWIGAAERFKHSSILLAYQTSLRLLVEHLSLLPSLPEHLVILKEHTSSLGVDAFSACLRNGALKSAVELIERGRSVFWNQLITPLHASLDDVIASGPAGEALANEFTRMAALIRGTFHSPGKSQHDNKCHLDLEMQGVVTAIRELPGLSRFLLPSSFSDLQHAASKGPVIIVNASKYGCDALVVLDKTDPVHIPLSITRDYVRLLSSKLRTSYERGGSRDTRNTLGEILRELWATVVFPIVRFLRTVHPLQSRIWWCPTAEFSDLPLHAAGPYREGQQNLPELYVSSYTPTLAALIHARRIPVSKSIRDAKRFVAIGQANIIGQSGLLSDELARIGLEVRGAATFRQIEGEGSRIQVVAEELGRNEWVHLACHGLSDRREPFRSAFALRDGHLTIEQIMRCKSEDPEFAYLSACQTTIGDEESPDEAIHLVSAMQFIGFRSVVGTMWSVDDKDADEIASTFYKHMLAESGGLDYTRAAFALNETMKSVTSITLDQRVLYIHVGA